MRERQQHFYRILAVAACLATTLTLLPRLSAESFEGPKRWLTNYSQARAESQRLGLPIVIHFSTSWCNPCQLMERETFQSPPVMAMLGSKYIGLKLDAEAEADLALGFRVDSYPTDIIVAPNGQIVSRKVGYQTQVAYVTEMRRWESQFEREREEAIAKLRAKSERSIATTTKKPMPDPMATNPTFGPITTAQTPNPMDVSRNMLIGLDGYSPVRIKNHREWIKGRKEFAVTYQGVTYFLSDENEYRLFNSTPERFAPKLLGCDPVVLVKTDEVVPGRIEIGAFYDGELYLFSSLENRNQFKLSPERFNKTRHVLNDEVGSTRFR